MSESQARRRRGEDKPKHPFEAGIDLYYAKKPEGDIDVVEAVREILINGGFTEDMLATTYDQYRHVKESKGAISPRQRTQICRFFSLALTQSPVSYRSLLADINDVTAPLHVWFEIIEKRIVPYLKQHRLMGYGHVQAG